MFATTLLLAALSAPPAVGDDAPDVALKTIDGETVQMKTLTGEGPTVVLVLRGYPGYQCPICSRQVAEYIKEADEFEEAGASVLMIYPGDVDDLGMKAKEFLGSTKLPENFKLVLDPGYTFTNGWDLRWDAPRETAYPSAFVIDSKGKVQAANVSKGHGGRVPASVALKALAKL